jgi:ferrous iron transport protein A
MPSLDQLRLGSRARVEAVRGDDAVVQRLLEMGLLEGEEVEVLGFAPLGDPLEIRLRDYRLSLRRSEAANRASPAPTSSSPSWTPPTSSATCT